MTTFEPILAFDNESADFALGFEAGRLWALLNDDPDALDGQPFHARNAEMVMRMLDALGGGLVAEFTPDSEWMVLRQGDGDA